MSGKAYRLDEAMAVEVRGEWVLALAAMGAEQFALAFSAEASAETGRRLVDGANLARGAGGPRCVARFAVLPPTEAGQPGELRLIMDDGSSEVFALNPGVLQRLARATHD